MTIAFIPARGGSKSIPRKNIVSFCGKPLIYWCARALQQSEAVDTIVIATDDEEIKRVVLGFGFDKLEVYDRQPENATDISSSESVMLEYIEKRRLPQEDLFMLVQATNPFITTRDIDEALALLKKENANSVLTAIRYKRFFWNDNGSPINYDFRYRPRRQDFRGTFMENGAFYISNVVDIINSKNRLSGKIAIYEMPEHSAFEIDEPDDWMIMEELFSRHILTLDVDKKPVKLFLSDVDGVMTDAGMYYSESGDELKKFNTHDGMAFQLLREAGIKTGIITTENTHIVERRAKKLKVDYLFQGKGFTSKLDTLYKICQAENIDFSQVAYIGDDLNCIEILKKVGVGACPANATKKVRQLRGILQLSRTGGDGVVREFVEWLFENNKISKSNK